MNASRTLLVFALSLGLCGLVEATTVPTDVALQFSATPNTNLHPGDVISFTLSVTNRGPEPVAGFSVGSSPIYDELELFNGGSSDCGNTLALAVADLENSFYYFFVWIPVGLDNPADRLEVGETRICHFTAPYTQWAPAAFPLTFDSDLVDLDASNNSATVVLRRAAAPATPAMPVPTLSPLALSLLAALLAASVAGFRLLPHRPRQDHARAPR